MKLDIEHYGLAIYKKDEGPKYRSNWKRNYAVKNSWSNGAFKRVTKKIAEVHYTWYFHFVIDMGKASKKPIVLWSAPYKNEETVKKVLEATTNAGSAMLLSKSNKKETNVVKNIVKLKMAYFGIDDIPIKWLTEDEWNGRYKNVNHHKNFVLDL